MKELITLALFQYIQQLKFLHWQTFGDAKHRTYGSLYDSLSDQLDDFIETMMGKYGRPEFPETFTIEMTNINSIDEEGFINEFVDYLISMSDILDSRMDSDLLNMRDEMLGKINQSKYLLTLKY